MKIQLLIAANDGDYADHLSRVLSERYAESYEVTVCSFPERLESLLAGRVFDVALIEAGELTLFDTLKVKLPLALWDETIDVGNSDNLKRIKKYQRISRISSDILEEYAKIAIDITGFGGNNAKVTVVWSPSGGVGKTTTALAYAASKAANGRDIIYLDLELFSSTHAYFPEVGKSISTVFQQLGGNVEILLKAIAMKDSGSGITYFSQPENFDDMNELTAQDIERLVSAAADYSDELVVDLPNVCDERFRSVIERADAVFIVVDGSRIAQVKLQQFITQHNLFSKIRSKAKLIANKNRNPEYNDINFNRTINLPLVSSSDPVSVYKTLSGISFE